MKRLINSLQLKFLYIVKAIKSKIKRWARDYGDICNFYHKELISLICKEFLQIKKNNNLIEKWEESINRTFTERQSKSPKHLGEKTDFTHNKRNENLKYYGKPCLRIHLAKNKAFHKSVLARLGGNRHSPAVIRFSTTSGAGVLVVPP